MTDLIDPFSQIVVFGKAYARGGHPPVALPVPGSVRIPTPKFGESYRGDGLKLVHVRNTKGGGGPATALERYTPSKGKIRSGRSSNSNVPDGSRRGTRAR